MRRFPVVIVAILVLGAVTPTAAAVNACTFDDLSGVVSVIVNDGAATIAAPGGVIGVDGLACGTATTATADSIAVTTTTVGDDVTLDLSSPLGPGKTDEGDDSSEIEVTIDGEAFSLVLLGGTGDDHVALASDEVTLDALGNLNGDETTLDTDLTFDPSLVVAVNATLDDGADVFDSGGWAAHLPLTLSNSAITVLGGAGDDRIVMAASSAVYGGGDGTDTFDLGWVPEGCVALITNGPGVAESTLADCASAFDFTIQYFERLLGHAGDDWFFGAGWAEELVGGDGDDRFIPERGDDTIVGGPGWDHLIADSSNGRVFTFDLDDQTLSGQGTDTYAGIEGLFSTSSGSDRFVGEPPASIDLIYGGGGHNIVDLSSSSHGFQVRSQIGADPSDAMGSGWLWVAAADVIGTPKRDRMVGDPGAYPNGHDAFRGGAGADRLVGSTGPDELSGGAGPDELIGGPGTDTCAGGPGNDTLKGCEA